MGYKHQKNLDNKKKIVIFIRTLKSGGAEKQSILLAKALKDKYETYLVVLYGSDVDKKNINYIKKEKINVVFLKGDIIKRIYRFIIFLKEKKIDIIFAFLASNNFYGVIAGRISHVRYIIGGIRNSKIFFFKFLIQRFLHNNVFQFTIFNNLYGKEELSVKGFDRNKIVVIPNCFELSTPPIKRLTKKGLKIISVGRFVEQKDYLTSIKAIRFLIDNYNSNYKISYSIIGYGKLEEQIRFWIKESDISEIVNLVINPDDTYEYYKNSDIFLMTSIFEGLPNSIMEAMSYSLPIVATDVGDINQLVKDGVNGYLTKIGDYKEIADKLNILIQSYKKRIVFGEKSYQILKKNYSFEIFQKRYIEFIETLSTK